jgi:hypothetical protein
MQCPEYWKVFCLLSPPFPFMSWVACGDLTAAWISVLSRPRNISDNVSDAMGDVLGKFGEHCDTERAIEIAEPWEI